MLPNLYLKFMKQFLSDCFETKDLDTRLRLHLAP